MTALAATGRVAPKATGYTILRAGKDPELDICLALPHVGTPMGATLDPVARRIELDLGPARLLLAELPADVVSLMGSAPDRILVITVDTLSQAQSSAKLSDLVRTTH